MSALLTAQLITILPIIQEEPHARWKRDCHHSFTQQNKKLQGETSKASGKSLLTWIDLLTKEAGGSIYVFILKLIPQVIYISYHILGSGLISLSTVTYNEQAGRIAASYTSSHTQPENIIATRLISKRRNTLQASWNISQECDFNDSASWWKRVWWRWQKVIDFCI